MRAEKRADMISWLEKTKKRGSLNYPIDLELLVDTLKGSIKYDGNFEAGVYGCIKRNRNTKNTDRKFVITINSEESSDWEKKFTIAHELGHLVLHMGFEVDNKKWRSVAPYKDSPYYRFGYSQEEAEADEFAWNLLIPETEFKNFIHTEINTKGSVSISAIAEKFNVPEPQVFVRAKNLDMLKD